MTAEEVKQKLLKASFSVVPFHRWTAESLNKIDEKAGYTNGTHKIFFPNGVSDFIDYFHNQLDYLVVEQVQSQNITGIRNGIFKALSARFEEYEKHRAFSIISYQYLCLPHKILLGKKIAWRTVDSIWTHIAMDKSTDFNYYTKRALLLGVYNLSSLYWISDESSDLEDTKDFIIRRLNDTVNIGKRIKGIIGA